MSDAFRKDFHTKAEEKATPNSMKSTQQKLKEGITDTADRVARGAVPDSQKSSSQAVHDKTQRASDRQVHGSGPQSVYVHGPKKNEGAKLTSGSGDKVKGALGLNHR